MGIPPARKRFGATGSLCQGPESRHAGRGRPGTPIADFHYEYDGMLLRRWETGVGQRQTLAGTVLRAEDHGSGPTLAPAGQTASFLAVKRDG